MEIFARVSHLTPQIAAKSVGFTSMGLKNIMWSLFGFVFLIYIGASLALMYHWRQYGMRSSVIMMMQILYFLVSLAILFLAFMALTLS